MPLRFCDTIRGGDSPSIASASILPSWSRTAPPDAIPANMFGGNARAAAVHNAAGTHLLPRFTQTRYASPSSGQASSPYRAHGPGSPPTPTASATPTTPAATATSPAAAGRFAGFCQSFRSDSIVAPPSKTSAGRTAVQAFFTPSPRAIASTCPAVSTTAVPPSPGIGWRAGGR